MESRLSRTGFPVALVILGSLLAAPAMAGGPPLLDMGLFQGGTNLFSAQVNPDGQQGDIYTYSGSYTSATEDVQMSYNVEYDIRRLISRSTEDLVVHIFSGINASATRR